MSKQMSRAELLALGGVASAGIAFSSMLTRPKRALALTPRAGQTVVAPNLKSASFGEGVGIAVKQDNVTIVNPYIYGYQVAIKVFRKSDGTWPKNLTVKLDPSAAGYAAAMLDSNHSGIRVANGSGTRILGASTSTPLNIRNSYRPVTFHSSDGALVQYVYSYGTYNWGGTRPYDGSIVGVKCLYDLSVAGAPYIFRGVVVDSCRFDNVNEESISFDPQNHDAGAAAVRDDAQVYAVDASSLTLSGLARDAANYVGMWVVMLTGGGAGNYYRITGATASNRVTLDTSRFPTSGISVGDIAKIGIPFVEGRFTNNVVNGQSGRVCVALTGFAENNLVDSNTLYAGSYVYGSRAGQDQRSVPQCVRVNSQVKTAGAPGECPAYGNAITNNACNHGDATLHWEFGTPNYTMWNYASGNTFDSGYQLYLGLNSVLR
jgi:hypothetical protein